MKIDGLGRWWASTPESWKLFYNPDKDLKALLDNDPRSVDYIAREAEILDRMIARTLFVARWRHRLRHCFRFASLLLYALRRYIWRYTRVPLLALAARLRRTAETEEAIQRTENNTVDKSADKV